MKVSQDSWHLLGWRLLRTPVLRVPTKRYLVRLHTSVFLEKCPPGRREERRDHLDALFAAGVDTYREALREGYAEAEAREVAHLQASMQFHRMGWTELMEVRGDELDAHYERHADFYGRHGVTVDDPLGEFAPPGGLPDAPRTPERLEDPEYPNAGAGFTDRTYVDAPRLGVRA